jgi:ABC-type dipeptide/oligopeptide/nickel transport system permease component
VALVIGVSLGMLAALHQNSWLDYAATLLAVSGTVFPNFVVGLALVVVFAVFLRWLPAGGWSGPKYWILPLAAYSLAPTAYLSRYTRSAMVEAMNQDYVTTARSKGLPERLVLVRHVLRNALVPILTVVGPIIADVFTGSLFIETIFRVPGLGRFFTGSVFGRDYPMIMATTLLLAALMSVINLITDIMYVWADPRIRLGGRSA